MNKPELIAAIAAKTEMTKKDAGKFVDAFIEAVNEGLKEEGRIVLSGFASFETKIMEPRIGRNPKTGESVSIPSKVKIACKFSKILKESVNA